MRDRPACPCGGYRGSCDSCAGEGRVPAGGRASATGPWLECPACGGSGVEWFHKDGCPDEPGGVRS